MHFLDVIQFPPSQMCKKTALAVAKTDNEVWDTFTELSGFPEKNNRDNFKTYRVHSAYI